MGNRYNNQSNHMCSLMLIGAICPTGSHGSLYIKSASSLMKTVGVLFSLYSCSFDLNLPVADML